MLSVFIFLYRFYRTWLRAFSRCRRSRKDRHYSPRSRRTFGTWQGSRRGSTFPARKAHGHSGPYTARREISRNGRMSSKYRRRKNTPDTFSPPVADEAPIKLPGSNSGLKIRKVADMRFFSPPWPWISTGYHPKRPPGQFYSPFRHNIARGGCVI